MKINKRKIILLSVSLFTFILFFMIQISGVFSILDLKIYDFLTSLRGIRPIDSKIVIVAVDDESMNMIGQKWQWNREIFANGLKQIAASKPRLILMDFMFTHNGNSKEDKAFSSALQDIAPIKVLSGITLTQRVTLENASQKRSYIMVEKNLKLPVFEEMDFGFINIETGTDATIRKTSLIRDYEGLKYQALTFKALSYLNSSLHQQFSNLIKSKKDEEFTINFAGPNKTYPWVSFYQIGQNLLPADFFKDKIVIIGPTFDDSQDFYFSPFFSYKGLNIKMAGVEIHANILDNLLNQLFLKPLVPLSQAFVFILFAFILFMMISFFSNLKKVFLMLLMLIVLYFAGIFILFKALNCVYPVFYPILASVFLTLIGLKLNYSWKSRDIKNELQQLKTSESFKLEDFCTKFDISKREKEILILMIQNFTNTQITKKLFISLSTVKTHITSIYKKTQVKNREELIGFMNSWNS